MYDIPIDLQPMRFLASILAIVVFMLSILPCADMDQEMHAPAGQKCYVGKSQGTDAPEQNKSDFCSPFCHCSCCGGIVLLCHPVAVTPILADVTGQQYAQHLPRQIIKISLPVWQPPQLV